MNEQELMHRFDESRASKYDGKIRRLSPAYEPLHQMTNQLLRSLLPANAHILVVGAGTGMDVVTCGRTNPMWRFTAVEPSQQMATLCRANIASEGFDDRVSIHCGYMEELPELPTFDAAISIFVSHFILSENDKSKFFANISSRLKADAPFVVADLHGDKNSKTFQILLNGWKTLYASLDVGEQEVEDAFTYIQRDISFVPAEQFGKLLKSNGFGEAHLFFRAFLFGGWVCKRQS